MKKLRGMAALLAMVLALSLSACGESSMDDLGDEYNQGTDYQYMFDDQLNMGSVTMARGEDGYFFLRGHYIYYMDDETQTLVPLCNKANCMHNEETDSDRYSDCNAYVEYASAIAYCNGYLYVMDGMITKTLYRIKEDGSVRESVMEWSAGDGVTAGLWSIHRDKIYYYEQSNEVDGEEVADVNCLKCASLKGSKTEPEVIYDLPDGMILVSFTTIQAYGNYVYFQVVAVTEEDYDLYYKEFIYNIQDGSLTELVPDEAEDAMVSKVTFWNGRVVSTVYDEESNESYGDIKLYVSDLDGSNSELLMDDVPYGTYIYGDGTYLYLTNYFAMVMGWDDAQYYEVYDEEMNLVDTFLSPFDNALNTCIGMEEGMYFWTTRMSDSIVDEDGDTTGYKAMVLHYFDKSAIGTHVVSDVEYIAKEILLMDKGNLLRCGTPQELLEEMNGKVYEVFVTQEEQREYEAGGWRIANVMFTSGRTCLRIVSDNCSEIGEVQEARTNLEDVYLYLVG